MTTSFCSICKLIDAQDTQNSPIIYCNEEIVLWQNMDVYLPGYFILAPRQHITDYAEISDNVASQLIKMTKTVVKILQEQHEAKKVYQCCFGELTPHIHFHLFPRYEWMQSIKEICDHGIIDGAKLFSFVRQKYAVNNNQEKQKSLLNFVNAVKKEVENACAFV